MAATVEGNIAEALFRHFSALSLPSGVRVAYPGAAFTPTEGQPYVRLTFVPNTPVQSAISFDAEPIRLGLLQVSVFWPAGQGVIGAMDLAGLIRLHFKRGTKIDESGVLVWIINEPEIAAPIQEPTWLHVPVTIPWHVYP